MVEIAEVVPFIGFAIAICVPFILKKFDIGKSHKDRVQEEIDRLDERLRQAEIKLARLERDNNHR